MGWLFCASSRAELIQHLKRDINTSTNLTVKPENFSVVGNILYALADIHATDTEPAYKTILVFKMAGGGGSPRYRWGYKDMDESMGPYVYTCPRKFLDASTCNNPTALDWRSTCYAVHAEKSRIAKLSKSLKIGNTYVFNDAPEPFGPHNPSGSEWWATQGKVFQLSLHDGKERWRSIKTRAFIRASKNWPLKEKYNPTLYVPGSE